MKTWLRLLNLYGGIYLRGNKERKSEIATVLSKEKTNEGKFDFKGRDYHGDSEWNRIIIW